MPFPATAVANEFLTIAKSVCNELTPMKVQKLVYFAHGWYLALTGRPLVSDTIQAWQYGPVIPSLYQAFKEYGNSPIGTPAFQGSWHDGRYAWSVPRLETSSINVEEIERARQVIRKVWDLYGSYTSIRLSNATHDPDGPWAQVYQDGIKSIPISNDKIKVYFQGLANASQR
jgi:uncharacterized phage-associated protein